jgi:ethanolamine utilization microcompartment shell protein EutS
MISATNSKLTAVTNPHVVANGQSNVAIRLVLRDENDAVIAQPHTVNFSASSADAVISQPAATNIEGITYGYVASFSPGAMTITATVMPANENEVTTIIEQTVSINFLAAVVPTYDNSNPRSVRLQWAVSRYLVDGADAVRVRIEATEAIDMPTAIFAYLALPMKPEEVTLQGSFDHVCSAVDLEEYPETEPLPNSEPKWFRLNYVDVLLRTREEAEDLVNGIVADVDSLKQALDRTENLVPGGDLWIGPGPD